MTGLTHWEKKNCVLEYLRTLISSLGCNDLICYLERFLHFNKHEIYGSLKCINRLTQKNEKYEMQTHLDPREHIHIFQVRIFFSECSAFWWMGICNILHLLPVTSCSDASQLCHFLVVIQCPLGVRRLWSNPQDWSIPAWQMLSTDSNHNQSLTGSETHKWNLQ